MGLENMFIKHHKQVFKECLLYLYKNQFFKI